MKKIRLALDWTANTNHTGFYVARDKGFYEEVGLAVELLTPDEDNYGVTPAKKVELGNADVALCPFESVLSYNTKHQQFDAVAIATIFREDVSALAVLQDADIKRPKDLDGTSYASYKARYEDQIVAQMIKNDGGKGELNIVYPDKLGIWETLLSGKYGATWIFTNWEGIHAKNKGVQLRTFKMSDFGIPYGYSPVILGSRSKVEAEIATYKAFLNATKRGFMYAIEHPKAAIMCLQPYISESDKDIDLLESQLYTTTYYGDQSNWGIMRRKNIEAFLDWLYQMNLETTHLGYDDLVFDGLW